MVTSYKRNALHCAQVSRAGEDERTCRKDERKKGVEELVRKMKEKGVKERVRKMKERKGVNVSER